MTPMSEERLKQFEEIQKDAGFLFGDYARECFAEIHRLQSELAEQRKEIETLQTRNNELSNIGYSDAWQIADLKKEIEELRKQVDELSATLRRTAKSF